VVDFTASQPQAKRSKNATTTTEDAPQPVETPSKKRGRPRKESLAANDTQLSSAKKRGRPTRESNIGVNEQPSTSKKRGRPASKDASVSVKESVSKEAIETPSKKRGRPAKVAPIVKSAAPSSAKKRGRPAKDASIATASQTSSPTKRGRPAKETATTAPAKTTTKAKAKSTPTKKSAAQPAKRGRPPKAKSAVVASTAKSGTRGAKPSAKKATTSNKKTESFPSKIGDILELSSPYIEGEWPDLAEGLELDFQPDTDNKFIWGRYNNGISEGYLRYEGPKLKKKMEFDYRGRAVNTGDGDRGVCIVEFKGQDFTATFTQMTGEASMEGVMDTKLSQSSSDTRHYANGWEKYETDHWGK
jgi:hypothetical protein